MTALLDCKQMVWKLSHILFPHKRWKALIRGRREAHLMKSSNNADQSHIAVWANERGSTTGSIHHKGYVQFYKRTRDGNDEICNRLQDHTARIEQAFGSVTDNRIYCKKEGWRVGAEEARLDGRRFRSNEQVREIKQRMKNNWNSSDILKRNNTATAQHHTLLIGRSGLLAIHIIPTSTKSRHSIIFLKLMLRHKSTPALTNGISSTKSTNRMCMQRIQNKIYIRRSSIPRYQRLAVRCI